VAEHAVVHRISSSSPTGPRFGVVVSKRVGGAVVRNRVRRRIQAVCATSIVSLAIPETDLIVIRALPGAGELSWNALSAEIDDGLRRVMMR
jgi:ribonuclease P protein component